MILRIADVERIKPTSHPETVLSSLHPYAATGLWVQELSSATETVLSIMLITSDFENFSIYGFAINYPGACRVDFNSKSRRESGDIAFRFQDGVRIFLNWGDLEKISKRFGSPEEHANYSLDAMKKGKNVINFERLSRDSMELHDHKSSINKVRFDEKTLKLFGKGKDISREAYSMHLHCDKSNRYFVLYTMAPVNGDVRFDRIMDSMRASLKCH